MTEYIACGGEPSEEDEALIQAFARFLDNRATAEDRRLLFEPEKS